MRASYDTDNQHGMWICWRTSGEMRGWKEYLNETTIQDYLDLKQDKLTAGTNITIDENNVISATGGASGDYYEKVDTVSISDDFIQVTNPGDDSVNVQISSTNMITLNGIIEDSGDYITGKITPNFLMLEDEDTGGGHSQAILSRDDINTLHQSITMTATLEDGTEVTYNLTGYQVE